MAEQEGKLLFLLHAHLPFVKHPEHPRFLEESWLFEALSETYLPLLAAIRRLEEAGLPVNISVSLSPTLMSMLDDELLCGRYVEYLEGRIELAEREMDRVSSQPELFRLAELYHELFSRNLEDFDRRHGRNVMRSFDYYAKRGRIELLTTLATHPFAPLYEQYPDNLRAQTQVALEEFRRNFGKHSQGLWLPEAGYSSGLDPILGESGIRYFFTAAHGVLFGDPRPKRGVYAPVRTQNGLYVFPREPASANAVWSSDEGYPGDFAYRDFYRDIGFDLPLDYVGPYLPAPNIRSNTGFKYYAITGDTEDKRVYDRDVALSRVEEHADNFLYIQRKLMAKLAPLLDREPLIVCPFDAELFGHWWFEGVDWLETVLRKIGTEDHGVSMVTPPQYIRAHPDNQRVDPAFSSWGNKGYSEVWLDGSNDWIYRHTHKAIERMMELCDRFPNEGGLRRRALNQAAREVLLSQASDWPFVMRAGTTVPYAVRRVKEHIANFTHIYESLSGSTVSTEWLTRTERRNSAFPDIDYRMFKQSIQRSGFPDIEIVK